MSGFLNANRRGFIKLPEKLLEAWWYFLQLPAWSRVLSLGGILLALGLLGSSFWWWPWLQRVRAEQLLRESQVLAAQEMPQKAILKAYSAHLLTPNDPSVLRDLIALGKELNDPATLHWYERLMRLENVESALQLDYLQMAAEMDVTSRSALNLTFVPVDDLSDPAVTLARLRFFEQSERYERGWDEARAALSQGVDHPEVHRFYLSLGMRLNRPLVLGTLQAHVQKHAQRDDRVGLVVLRQALLNPRLSTLPRSTLWERIRSHPEVELADQLLYWSEQWREPEADQAKIIAAVEALFALESEDIATKPLEQVRMEAQFWYNLGAYARCRQVLQWVDYAQDPAVLRLWMRCLIALEEAVALQSLVDETADYGISAAEQAFYLALLADQRGDLAEAQRQIHRTYVQANAQEIERFVAYLREWKADVLLLELCLHLTKDSRYARLGRSEGIALAYRLGDSIALRELLPNSQLEDFVTLPEVFRRIVYLQALYEELPANAEALILDVLRRSPEEKHLTLELAWLYAQQGQANWAGWVLQETPLYAVNEPSARLVAGALLTQYGRYADARLLLDGLEPELKLTREKIWWQETWDALPPRSESLLR